MEKPERMKHPAVLRQMKWLHRSDAPYTLVANAGKSTPCDRLVEYLFSRANREFQQFAAGGLVLSSYEATNEVVQGGPEIESYITDDRSDPNRGELIRFPKYQPFGARLFVFLPDDISFNAVDEFIRGVVVSLKVFDCSSELCVSAFHPRERQGNWHRSNFLNPLLDYQLIQSFNAV